MADIELVLPTMHADQVRAFRSRTKRHAIRCGRRWGKTLFGQIIAADAVVKSQYIGWFAPEYKYTSETYSDLEKLLGPIKASASKTDGVIKARTGGRLDFWTLDNQAAGRSRKYHGVIIDEAAFTKDYMKAVWEQSIEPTLLDYQGWALVLSNTNGVNPANFMWRVCNEPDMGFTQYHAPTASNPFMPADELARLKEKKHPLVWAQEYCAEFVDFSGVAFFSADSLLHNGRPVPYPNVCDNVFAIVDCAVKAGAEHDGTAVSYWAFSPFGQHQLICLDYDIVQIEGALLETWIPNVFRKLIELATRCNARYGSIGAMIEDAAAGIILLQQCAKRGWPASALPSALTAAGKDARAINVSGYVHQGLVKWSDYAADKVVTFKEATRNHLLSQVYGFRVGDKDAAKRADDLLDTFTYAIAVALGNSEGF